MAAPQALSADGTAPESLEERAMVHCIVWTFAWYLLGALYLLAPVLGWLLLARAARRGNLHVPTAAVVWAAGMGAMLIPLLVAHADFDIGAGPLLKSAVGWTKGWALIAVFILLGGAPVRLAVLARAVNLLGIQLLVVLPVLMAGWAAGLPERLYVSPLSAVGGPGPEFFEVVLYSISPDSGRPRWSLFTPWAPALGLVMSAYLVIGASDPDTRRRRWARAGMVLAILLSSSRLGLFAVPMACAGAWLLRRAGRPAFHLTLSGLAVPAALFAQPVAELAEQAMAQFHGARADSSRVRAALGRIAVDRWLQDGFWWGHGNVERGPHLVEYMPIGSHHTWYGVLFVKGLCGAAALAVPMAWSAWVLLRSARFNRFAITGVALLLLLFVYTFAENLEVLAYLFWPALVVIGIALREADAPREPLA